MIRLHWLRLAPVSSYYYRICFELDDDRQQDLPSVGFTANARGGGGAVGTTFLRNDDIGGRIFTFCFVEIFIITISSSRNSISETP